MNILTWNIGSFITERVFHALSDDPNRYEYFQPTLNAALVSDTIRTLMPTIVCLQELYSPKDTDSIDALTHYRYHYILDTWYRPRSVLVASTAPLGEVTLPHGDHGFFYNNLLLVPLHLHSYSARTRRNQIEDMLTHTQPYDHTLLFGDFNFWMWKEYNLFPTDAYSHRLLTERFHDYSIQSGSTTRLGFALDRFYGTGAHRDANVTPHRIYGTRMDHYPVSCTLTE